MLLLISVHITNAKTNRKENKMTNQEARKVTYDKCPVKCASCEEECDSTAVGACRHNLEAYMEKEQNGKED